MMRPTLFITIPLSVFILFFYLLFLCSSQEFNRRRHKLSPVKSPSTLFSRTHMRTHMHANTPKHTDINTHRERNTLLISNLFSKSTTGTVKMLSLNFVIHQTMNNLCIN